MPLVAHDADDGAETLDLGHGQAAGGFVEQEEFWPHRQRAGDFQEALGGVFQQVGAAVQHAVEADAAAALRRRGRRISASSRRGRGAARAVSRNPERTSGQPPSMALSSTESEGSSLGV